MITLVLSVIAASIFVSSIFILFNSSLNLNSLINLLKGFDFTFNHKINATLSSKKYHDCKIVKVNYAYCNFIVDSGTYVKGGIGDTGIHAEYDEDGNLYGIYDKDGNQVSNLFKDEVTGKIEDEFGNTYFDEESMQVEMKDAYEFFQEKKENVKNGITNSINDLIDSIKGFFSSVIIILLVGLGIYVVIKVVKKKRG